MSLKKRLELITRNTEEILTIEELEELLDKKTRLRHYIGFEVSGKIHLGTGIVCMSKVADFQKAGASCTVFLADWHSWINDKLGGNMDFIKKVAVGYFKEGMKASLKCVGGEPNRIKFVLGSDLYHNNDRYWQTMIRLSKHTTLNRIKRSITIMGRKEDEAVDFAKLIYPPMQAADIFALDVNIAHAGIDQRSAHIIAREAAQKIRLQKPVAVHHPLILGLQKPPVWPIDKDKIKDFWSLMKMSKSIPQSAVFVHDEPEEIRSKLNNAFCPAKETGFNPVLDWAKHVVFTNTNKLKIERSKRFGGDIAYSSYKELEKDFAEGRLHPQDLKTGVALFLIRMLEPARKHFKNPRIARLREELESIK